MMMYQRNPTDHISSVLDPLPLGANMICWVTLIHHHSHENFFLSSIISESGLISFWFEVPIDTLFLGRD